MYRLELGGRSDNDDVWHTAVGKHKHFHALAVGELHVDDFAGNYLGSNVSFGNRLYSNCSSDSSHPLERIEKAEEDSIDRHVYLFYLCKVLGVPLATHGTLHETTKINHCHWTAQLFTYNFN